MCVSMCVCVYMYVCVCVCMHVLYSGMLQENEMCKMVIFSFARYVRLYDCKIVHDALLQA